MKKFIVIAAAFKAEKFLGEMLASFEAQQPTPGWEYELVIGVDACLDTAGALDLAGVPYWWSAENVGAYVLRNSLIARHQADAYAIFDADDIMEPDFLAAHIPGLEAGQVVACHKRTFTDHPGDGAVSSYGGGICAFPAAAWAAVGGYRPERVSGDTDLVCRFNLAGFRLEVLPRPLYHYRRHPDSLTGATATNCASEYRLKIAVAHDAARMAGEIKVDPQTVALERRHPAARASLAGLDCSVVVAAPHNLDCPARAAAWEYCRRLWERLEPAEIIEVWPAAGGDQSQYCKAAAVNAGAAVATGKTLIVADADVVMSPAVICRAVRAVASGRAHFAAPNTHVLRLTEAETADVIGGSLPFEPAEKPYKGQAAGGLFVVSRDTFATVGGMDTRFQGWGGEDSALSVVMRALGQVWQPAGMAVLWHLWHPAQPGRPAVGYLTHEAGSRANADLWQQYRDRELRREELLALRFAVDAQAKGKEPDTMRFQILRGTVLNGRRLQAGAVVEIPAHQVELFVGNGLAVEWNEPAARDAAAVASVPRPDMIPPAPVPEPEEPKKRGRKCRKA